MGNVRSVWGRRRAVGMAGIIASCVLAIGLLATGNAVAKERDSIPPIFQQSKWTWVTPIVKPEKGGPTEAAYESRILLNKAGGGGAETKKLSGTGGGRCEIGDILLSDALGDLFPACFGLGSGITNFLDPRLVRGPYSSIITGPKYSSTGNAVDSLKDRPRQTRNAVNRIAVWLAERYNDEPIGPPAAVRLGGAVEILSNPLIHESTRQTIIDMLVADDRFSEAKEASDQRGRDSLVISTPDQGRFEAIEYDGKTYRGKNTLFTRKLYFDPDTAEILAARTVLKKTDLPQVRAFLRGEGGSAIVQERVFARSRQVRDRDFAQKRIPCESGGNNCFQIGDNDGIASVG